MNTGLPLVQSLIPHRGRFLLIDRLVQLEDDQAQAIGHLGAFDDATRLAASRAVRRADPKEAVAALTAAVEREWNSR